jgi:hypothetical protein
MGVRQSGDSGMLWWCGFNTSTSAREGRRWDKALSKDEVEVTSSSLFNGKKG